MSRLTLDPASLSVATFDPQPGDTSTPIDAVTTAVTVITVLTRAETNDQICFCLTWVPEDCFGPTAGCSTDPAANPV